MDNTQNNTPKGAPGLLTIEEVKQLPPKVRNDLQESFDPIFQEAKKWEKEAKSIKVTDINDVAGMEKARELRLKLKGIRINAENTRKQLKEESLLKGRAIDGLANLIKYLTVPLEKHLEEQEKYAEKQEEKRLDALVEDRTERLSKYVEDVSIYDLRVMSEEAFKQLLDSQKELFEIREQKEKERIEKERRTEIIMDIKSKIDSWGIEGVKIDDDKLIGASEAKFTELIAKLDKEIADKIEAIRTENQRLHKEKVERDHKYSILFDAGFKFDGQTDVLIHKASDQVLHMVRLMETDDSVLEDMAKKARKVDKANADKEEEEKQKAAKKLEEERKKREALEEKIRKDEEEKKRKESEDAERERQAKLAPDKDKLKVVAARYLDMEFPVMKSKEGKKIIAEVKELNKKINLHIVENIEKL